MRSSVASRPVSGWMRRTPELRPSPHPNLPPPGGQESSPLPRAVCGMFWRLYPSRGREKSGLKEEKNLESPTLKCRRTFLYERRDTLAEILCFAARCDLMRLICHLGFKAFVETG